ncbi:MAG: phosphotransferase family protein [Actinomycetota bacterium]
MDTDEELGPILAAVSAALPSADRSADPLVLDAGWDCLVLQMGSTVVRVARHELGRRRQELEVRLLPALAGRLPASVAGPLTEVAPGPGLPFGAVTYPYIPGRPMMPGDETTWPSLASDLAHLLASVHGTPVARAAAAGIPVWTAVERMPALVTETDAALAAELTPEERATFERAWGDAAAALALHPPAPVLCHGDPWYDNILIDEASGRIAAILDFGHAVVADGALDLAAVYHLGDGFGGAVVAGYQDRRGRDPSLAARIGAHRLIREVAGLADAVATGPDEIADQIARIRALLSGPGFTSRIR